jgi:hypothetical protein
MKRAADVTLDVDLPMGIIQLRSCACAGAASFVVSSGETFSIEN